MTAPLPAPAWTERLLAARDRLLASSRFQRWAAAFPLTRPIARRHARALFDHCAGFVYSQILFACVRLRLLEKLQGGARSAADLAPELGLSTEAAERLLRAAAALRLAEPRGGNRWGLGLQGAAMLGNPGIAAMVEHHAMLYADLADPVALLREETRPTRLQAYWAYARSGRPDGVAPAQVADYTALMAASQPMIAGEVLDLFPVHEYRCVLDVGGGDGTFLRAAAARAPDRRLVLFDLPAVAATAAQRFAAAGLGDRATVVGGSFFSDPLPTGADLVSLVRVLHDHDDAAAMAILRAIRRVMPDDGTLLLAEPLAGTAGAEPVGDAYFGFYLLAMGSGRARRRDEVAAMLRAAGFSRLRFLRARTPMLTSVATARP